MQKVLIHNTTPEEDEKLRNCIIQSANKTQSLVDKCAVMKTDLREVASFVQQFNSSESQMRQIVREFLKIAEELREMQSKTDTVGTVGVVFVIGGILAAPFTTGLSLAVGATAAAATVVTTNVIKILSEKDKAKEVKKWGEEFMAKVRLMMKNLEDIKTICEKLEKESAEAQAKNSQIDVDEFQRTLRQVSHLNEMSSGLLIVTETLDVMGGLVMLIKEAFRVTATPEEDQKLRDAIKKAVDQSQKIIEEFDKMRTKLKEFTSNKRKYIDQ
ncbi:uncharacterized protein LOC112847276 isoform X2 [Oreochromis niloticus]|uniref:uncharacterized protein LOC112847276 isoform X2 n=1 Tax=Oreochromis niloticus TaxID=8128 RepID=UPI000DF472C5|nr:uncharacterized protein LOC112847276 isoform X2 [Oreochromis niloticus]